MLHQNGIVWGWKKADRIVINYKRIKRLKEHNQIQWVDPVAKKPTIKKEFFLDN